METRGGQAIKTRRANGLQTLDRSLKLLAFFTWDRPEWSVSELARASGLPKTTVHKTLKVFAKHGLLHQAPDTRRYRLGLRWLVVAEQVSATHELARLARPILQRLTRATGETAKLTRVEDGQAVIVAAVESPHSMRMTGREGERNPLHRGASNKVIAAYMASEELLRSLQADPDGAALVSDAARFQSFKEDLERIAQAGHAVTTGELEEGVTAVSAPVWSAPGRVLGSVSIVGPAIRFSPRTVELAIAQVRAAGQELSELLGFGGSADPQEGSHGAAWSG